MFVDPNLNRLFKFRALEANEFIDYRLSIYINELAKKYQNLTTSNAIGGIINMAMDELLEDDPMRWQDIEDIIVNIRDKKERRLSRLVKEAKDSDNMLIHELEPIAKRFLLRYEPCFTHICFREILKDSSIAAFLNRQEDSELLEAIIDIDATNQVIDFFKSEVSTLFEEIMGLDEWMQSVEYEEFASAYQKSRSYSKRIINRMKMDLRHV